MTAKLKSLGITITIVTISTLFIANTVSSFIRREERKVIPSVLCGNWISSQGDRQFSISPNEMFVKMNGKRYVDVVDHTVIYYDEPFMSYLFGERKIAVILDKPSTKSHYSGEDYKVPEDHRKTYYFSLPEQDLGGRLKAKHTVYMRGYSDDSWGAYTWPVGDLYPR